MRAHYMHTCMYMHAHIHTCIHTYIHACIHTWVVSPGIHHVAVCGRRTAFVGARSMCEGRESDNMTPWHVLVDFLCQCSALVHLRGPLHALHAPIIRQCSQSESAGCAANHTHGSWACNHHNESSPHGPWARKQRHWAFQEGFCHLHRLHAPCCPCRP